jgi:hypothetical protein
LEAQVSSPRAVAEAIWERHPERAKLRDAGSLWAVLSFMSGFADWPGRKRPDGRPTVPGGNIFPGDAAVAAKTGIAVSTVERAIRELVKLGELEKMNPTAHAHSGRAVEWKLGAYKAPEVQGQPAQESPRRAARKAPEVQGPPSLSETGPGDDADNGVVVAWSDRQKHGPQCELCEDDKTVEWPGGGRIACPECRPKAHKRQLAELAA